MQHALRPPRFLLGEGGLDRKQWIAERLEELAGMLAVPVAGLSVMDSHLHARVRPHPDSIGKAVRPTKKSSDFGKASLHHLTYPDSLCRSRTTGFNGGLKIPKEWQRCGNGCKA